MTFETKPSAKTADRTLVITRVFDAPRALVWKAWTDPEHRARWMGPRGFSGRVIRMDLRAGGAYRFQMRQTDGTELWQQGVFHEIVEPERLVCTYVWTDEAGNPTRPETTLSLTFEDQGDKTRLTLRQSLFESVAARDDHKGGWSTSLDKLAEHLARAKS